MKTFIITAVLAVAGAALAKPQVASEYPDGQPQVATTSAPVAYGSTSTVVMTSSSMASAVPYPVPGGNSTMHATGTAPVASHGTYPTMKHTMPGMSSVMTSPVSGSPSTPSASAPVTTGAASAITLGSGAIFAGLLALLA